MNDRAAQRWRRAKEIAAQAMEMPVGDHNALRARDAFVREQCAGDPELLEQVLSLLTHHDPADGHTTTVAGTPLTEKPGTVIGRYKLLQQIGEGGFGVVFLAEQREPVVRKVALKIIKLGMDTRQVIARFEAERQALALMDHPNIARVFDGGATDTGRPYFVMEYVRGVPITEYCDANQLSPRERVELLVPVCRAVQHAHQKGVIHRDIKPSNILVTLHDGVPVPKVIDFGIAKATAARLTEMTLFTEHRQMIGTPAYMSPEQAEMSGLDIDTRTDVYSLGVLLYELLTGSTPLDATKLREAGYAEILRMIREVEPPTPSVRVSTRGVEFSTVAARRKTEPRRLGLLLRGDLDWIVMKALEKDRRRRYETASDMAADLGRHLAGEAVVAAPPSRVYRLRKFVRKNKGAVATVSTVMLALGAGVSVAAWQWNKAQQAKLETEAVNESLRQIVARVYRTIESVYAESKVIWDGYDEVVTRRKPQTPIQVQLLGTPSGGTFGFTPKDQHDLSKGFTFLYVPSSKALASFNNEKLIFQPDKWSAISESLPTGTGSAALAKVTEVIDVMGEMILESSLYKRRGFDELSRAREAAEWQLYTTNIAFAQAAMEAGNWPEARERLAACPVEKRGWEWRFCDLMSRTTLFELKGHASAVQSARFSPDGARIVTASGDSARIWDATSGASLAELKGHSDPVYSAAFSPDGTRIVTASQDGTARVWDAASGASLVELKGHTAWVRSAKFSPDGTRIVTASGDDSVRVWDATSGASLVELKGHTQWIGSAPFSPDGTRIAAASQDGTVRVWDAASGASLVELKGHAPWVGPAAFSPDGTRIVTASIAGTAWVWDSTSGASLVELKGHTEWVGSAEFSPDGTRIVTASQDGTARVWDAASGASLVELKGHSDPVSSAAFSPDGARIATVSGGTVQVRDASDLTALEGPERILGTYNSETLSWSPIPLLELELAVLHAAMGNRQTGVAVDTRDGTRRIVSSADDTIRFFDPRVMDGERAVFRVGRAVRGLELSADGTRLLIHFADGVVHVWDIRDPEERHRDQLAKWAERGPAARYVDTLWAATNADGSLSIPNDKLHEAVINDVSLTPLRRLVAAEMLEERLEVDRIAAEQAFASIEEGEVEQSVVLARAMNATQLPPRVQERVIARAAEWKPNADSLNGFAWQIVLERTAAPDRIQAALKAARTAVELAPNNGAIVNTLGVALYRAGDYEAALATLERSTALHASDGPQPADVAFVAMSKLHLGRVAEARQDLVALRGLTASEEYKDSVKVQAFLAEAEALIQANSTLPK